MKFCAVVGLQMTVLRFEFHRNRISGFGALGVEICPSSLTWPLAYTTACRPTTVQAVITPSPHQTVTCACCVVLFATQTHGGHSAVSLMHVPLYHFAPGRGAKYCDERVCLSVGLSVCLSARARISQRPHIQTSRDFSVHVSCGLVHTRAVYTEP